MKVLFDFELTGEVGFDSHLLDLMLCLKTLINTNLDTYKEAIEKDDGSIVVTMIKNQFNMAYWHGEDKELFYTIQQILESLDWESAFRKFGRAENN